MTNLDLKPLLTEEDRLVERLKRVRQAIASLRGLCDHHFMASGHDSHKNYQRCTLCGHEEMAP